MRPISAQALESLSGSRIGERLIAHAWYDGVCVEPSLPVSDWTIISDGSRQVRTQASVAITDDDGTLAPWGVDDALGVGGARLQLLYSFPGAQTVDMGWYRVTRATPSESWTLKSTPTRPEVWVSGGAQIPVEATDLTCLVAADKLLAPESARAGATIISEVRRLLAGIMPVTVKAGVNLTKLASPSTVYARERMDAVEDLLNVIGATHRMTGDGQLEVYPTTPTDPVWTVEGGEEGVMVALSRDLNIEDLPNIGSSEGADDDGRQLIGTAIETTGPLRVDGPHGRRPKFHAATGILKTQAAVDADARTLLFSSQAERAIDLTVTCLLHPGLQPGDSVAINVPTTTGDAMKLIGVVRTTTMRGGDAGPSPMTMVVRCPFEDIQALRAAIRRAS